MTLKLPPNNIPFLRRFSRDKSGVVAVEMTLVLIPFMLLFLFVAELCSVLYVSVSIDLAMAEAMRYTSSTAQDDDTMANYKQTFLARMESRIRDLPLMVYDAANVDFSVKYCSTLTQLASGSCNATVASAPQYAKNTGLPVEGSGTPIAYYTVEYKYTPLFLPIPNSIINPNMVRKGIYVMENTRVRKWTA